MASFEKNLTEFLDSLMSEYKLPGYDCSVYHRHQEIYRHRAGFADLETQTPISENTLYNIYSNTKVITCVAAMQLYEQGKFLLEDPVSRFYPEFANMKVKNPDGTLRDAERPITIRDLFRMTAGIGDGGDYAEMGMQFYMETGGNCPVVDLPRYLARVPLFFEPGTQFRYGICHEVLAGLIELLSGQKFSEYLEAHIFRPLGMENTAFTLDKCKSKELATQYRFQGPDQELKNEGPANCLIPPILKESASGGLISSVDDYMKFQEALCKENILLNKRTTDLMRLDQLDGNRIPGYGYAHVGMGYGLGVRTVINQAQCGDPVGFGPYGWGGAAGTYGSIDPENQVTIFYAQHLFGSDDLRNSSIIRNIVYSHI